MKLRRVGNALSRSYLCLIEKFPGRIADEKGLFSPGSGNSICFSKHFSFSYGPGSIRGVGICPKHDNCGDLSS